MLENIKVENESMKNTDTDKYILNDKINSRVIQMLKIQSEGLSLFEKKNKDYGDAFAKYGTIGVLIRIGDKISRLQSITKSGINLVNDEQLRDTLIDLHNYSAMAIMLLDEGKEMNINEQTYSEPNSLDDSNNQNDLLVNNANHKSNINSETYLLYNALSGLSNFTL